MELTSQDFANLSKFVYKKCGIVVKKEKTYLIQQRLSPIVIAEGCKSFDEFYLKISKGCNNNLHDQIIVAITTNETSFFRDNHPFETFKKDVLPQIEKVILERKSKVPQRKGAKIRLWCAASSTGQEPYCIAMIIYEYVQMVKSKGITIEDFEILATDISSKVLGQAIAGEFNEYEVLRGLPAAYKNRYFAKGSDGLWVIDEKIRDLVEFRRLNLMERFTMLGGFDIIFCRNVLIYFDDDAKRKILDQFFSMLSDDGYLFLGATESVYGLTDMFKSVRTNSTILYKKNIKST